MTAGDGMKPIPQLKTSSATEARTVRRHILLTPPDQITCDPLKIRTTNDVTPRGCEQLKKTVGSHRKDPRMDPGNKKGERNKTMKLHRVDWTKQGVEIASNEPPGRRQEVEVSRKHSKKKIQSSQGGASDYISQQDFEKISRQIKTYQEIKKDIQRSSSNTKSKEHPVVNTTIRKRTANEISPRHKLSTTGWKMRTEIFMKKTGERRRTPPPMNLSTAKWKMNKGRLAKGRKQPPEDESTTIRELNVTIHNGASIWEIFGRKPPALPGEREVKVSNDDILRPNQWEQLKNTSLSNFADKFVYTSI